MRNITLSALAVVLSVGLVTPALSEPYVDYTPQKGFWRINAIEVDPNHVDDYLTGLRKSQITAFSVLQRRGLIDDYKLVVRHGYVKGSPNVLIMTHSASMGSMDADKARDQAIDAETYALFSKDQSKTAVAGYEKYRTFIDDAMWTEMTMAK